MIFSFVLQSFLIFLFMAAPVQLRPHKAGDLWGGLAEVSIRVDGVPLDLEGAVVKMHFKRFVTDQAAALELSSAGEAPGIVFGEEPGVFQVPERVVALRPGRYFWDIQVTTGAGPVTYASGTWQITPDVSA